MERSQIDGDDALIRLPPGFRFHPTDEEIVTHYLTPKFHNRSFTAAAIGEADLNKSEPWDLPDKAKMGENEWFFFCQRDRKYPTGIRTNRATESGYWKATGKDKEIFRQDGELVGMKKTLVFYRGRAPRGEKTNWVMHEFRLEGKFSYYNMSTPSTEDEWVVCRVFHKTTGGHQSMVSNHGLNSFVEELLHSPPHLPSLMDHSTPDLNPSFTIGHSYFPHDQPEELPEDYKNILGSSSSYDFNNTYQSSSFMMNEHQHVGNNPPYLTSESTLYSPDSNLKKEKSAVDQCREENNIPAVNRFTKNSLSQNMPSIEPSSTSMLSEHDLRTNDYDQDDDEDDDDAGPSTFIEFDSFLQY
ncbi:hypothetical protein QVD17_32769 [Tagetes erecta]|uniref:NAC domain-containing protein n=1 Tax=Tagetes erecta TaxID=13708 RepID=A0AAD8NDJ1_TARER|nr:hypothetical protein QVD17_32769 [Tagetes erecta]